MARNFTLISNSLYVPDDYLKEGVHTLKSETPNTYIYKIDSINGKEADSYTGAFVAEFVFLGSELPKIKISTSNTGVKIKDIDETRESYDPDIFDSLYLYLYINWQELIVISVIGILVILYFLFSDKVARYNIRHSMKHYLESLGKTELSDTHIENIVKQAELLYKKYASQWEGLVAAPVRAIIK